MRFAVWVVFIVLAGGLMLVSPVAAAPGPPPQVSLGVDPAVPVVGHKILVYLYTTGQEIAPGYMWDVRARPLAGGMEIPIEMRRIGAEPRFWQGEIVFPNTGEWQLVAGGVQAEAWPAAGTTPGNIVVPVVSGKSALAPNDLNAPWEIVMASGGAGVLVGTVLGWLVGRRRGDA